jgi:hypothetical protein|tara:strand:- start:1774 stop:2361 length:588 start_codon:yes stop_codon:yes gene_type:complete
VPAYIFTDILSKATQKDVKVGTQRARQFFRKEGKRVNTTPSRVMRPDDRSKLTSRPTIGRMYFFNYDPKLKRELPYYDRFPLIFMIGPAEGGFYGINLHYLAPTLRARLMDALYDTITNQNYDETTRLRISYNILKGATKFRFFKPCVKHYLVNKVQGRFLEVFSNEWDIALFLPVERFEKANKRQVFNDSQRQI